MFKGVLDDEEERMRLINQTLSTLTAREEKVLRLYYGIDDRRSTLPEIGQDLTSLKIGSGESRTREFSRL